MPPRVLPLAALAAVLPLCACYRLATPGPARATVRDPHSPRQMNAYAWGLIQDDGLDSICQGYGGIAEVRATTTPLYALATIATLGFWAPVRVEAQCLAPRADDERQ